MKTIGPVWKCQKLNFKNISKKLTPRVLLTRKILINKKNSVSMENARSQMKKQFPQKRNQTLQEKRINYYEIIKRKRRKILHKDLLKKLFLIVSNSFFYFRRLH